MSSKPLNTVITRRQRGALGPSADQRSDHQRRCLEILEEALRDQWNLGRNIIVAWMPAGDGLSILAIPHYALASRFPVEVAPDDHFIQGLLTGDKLVTPERMDEIMAALRYAPSTIELPFTPGTDVGMDLIEQAVRRYGLTYVADRAVVLFDIVGFSLYTPLEQVTQLNSLAYSVNAAHSRLLARDIQISFARTTTGDGFYVWNRERSIQANVNLYHFMHLVLADNALARRKARGNVTPLLRTSFHVGGHYEFYQSEGLNPTIYSYIVGDVTIELARLIERAVPGQVVVGDFEVPMADTATGKVTRVNTVQFIERTQESLSGFQGLELSGEEISDIKCYLTGGRADDGRFSIKKYLVTDKHGLTRDAYNAKINIYRRDAEPIYLGCQDSDLVRFAPVIDGTDVIAFE